MCHCGQTWVSELIDNYLYKQLEVKEFYFRVAGKRTFCSVLKVILNSKDASAVAEFGRNFVWQLLFVLVMLQVSVITV